MLSRVVFCGLVVLLFVGYVFAQGGEAPEEPPQIPPPLNDGSFEPKLPNKDKINLPQTLNCHLVTSKEILGYEPKTNKPVYKRACSGVCISLVLKPNTCQATYKTYLLAPTPNASNLKKVSVIESCGCKPQPCKVVDKDTNAVTTYPHGAVMYDACEQKCTCSYGKAINCCRQRKEFRLGMTTTERTRYINAIKIASTDPLYKPQYDALITEHFTFFNLPPYIHGVPRFLPWHRLYILRYEDLLRKIDCRITVPYWDWSKEAANPFASSIWGSGADDMGGNGVGPGGCVATGPFASPWTVTTGACLTRNFNLGATFATPADIQGIYTTYPDPSDYDSMRSSLEGAPGMHNAVHTSIGGIMLTTSSSNAPEFFLHHTFIDKLWSDWQNLSPAHVSAFSGSLSMVMPGGGKPSDVMDLNAQYSFVTGQTVRICYVKPQLLFWLNDLLVSLTPIQLNSIARTPVATGIPWLQIMLDSMDIRNRTIIIDEAIHEEAIRNGLEGSTPFAVIPQSEALKCNCITSSIGLGLEDSTLDGLDLDISGCVDPSDPEEPSTDGPIQCVDDSISSTRALVSTDKL